jgi:hypothetical protein
VDDELIEQSSPFCTPAVRPLNVLHLYNFDHTQSWWDNIEFLREAAASAIAIAPTVTGNFNGGVWSGDVTVLQRATNVLLTIDANGRTGTANLFSAFAFLPVFAQVPLSQGVVAGDNVTFSALMSGTLPMEYEWRKTQIPLHTNLLLLSDRLSFFTLTNVQSNLAGEYQLTVRNVAGVASALFSVTLLTDGDGDGLPNIWEAAYRVSEAHADADLDGMSNLAEYQAGTNPTNPASLFRLEARWAGNDLRLQFQPSLYKTYGIQQTTALNQNNWVTLIEFPARAMSYTASLTNPVAAGAFYRVVTPAR